MNQIVNAGQLGQLGNLLQLMQLLQGGTALAPATEQLTPAAPANVVTAPAVNTATAPVQEPVPHPAWDQRPVAKKVRDVFGFAEAPDAMTITTYQPVADARVPYRKANEDYHFRKDLFSLVASFMQDADGESLLLTGPHGSGKTSVITEFCARTGQPVVTVTGRKGLEVPDLLGQWIMSDRGFVWVDGPLTLAVRYGYVLVFNEAFLCSPGELTGLNDVAEGNPLCLVQKGGEIVPRHPQFRLVLTDNSGGQGDQTGLYAGVVAQNPSLLDRCCKMVVSYPDPAAELVVLKRKLEKLGAQLEDEILQIFIEVANSVRDVFTNGNGAVELTVTMSTRTLIRWMRRTLQFRLPNGKPGIAKALDFALTATIDSSERTAIHEIARAKFGRYWEEA